ncbi:NAD(P)-dependent oxidoreductase [Denitromonas ohlonensis]|jgi:2-hydroxy-3-oxopropionate reductase|uniref:NAD(P)-dependent oxidoreductase n=2 Tax=Denitromonas TaxID=139331 RepID=A0A557SNH8_9RHOO|nr:NAD(P)-dependent oxidoreductase [Denitromonas ohlonensis]TVO62668.1 NAD(P)-dependent oxidoreductase [Denitromonas ohlonensis]TVO78872.1 NAD(P)-dependent oxidoreductase [Denitromonas ohlonensis]TVT75152.1 MAG: NAD(P)-dependent oxidoreductase [Denitromonas halophila]
MNIGFIGLGLMGRPMVLNLRKAGFPVSVWARREASLAAVTAAGAVARASIAEVAAASDVVFSCVPDAPQVAEVAQAVADGAHDGLVFADMSTIAPAAARDIAAQLKSRGVSMLDAPVSGGETGAIAGTLTIMVGGEQAAFDTALPAFQAMGKSVTRVGESGAGQVTKACNQIVTGVGVAAVAEAFNFAQMSGVDPARVREALLGGFANSRILDNHGQRMIDRKFTPGFKAWMHQKDLRIVMEEAHAHGLALPAAAATAQLFNALVGRGMGEDDSVAMLKLFEAMSGGAA